MEEYEEVDLSRSLATKLDPKQIHMGLKHVMADEKFENHLSKKREIDLVVEGAPIRGMLELAERPGQVLFTSEDMPEEAKAGDSLFLIFEEGDIQYISPVVVKEANEQQITVGPQEVRADRRFKTKRSITVFVVPDELKEELRGGGVGVVRKFMSTRTTMTKKGLLVQEYFDEIGESIDPATKIVGAQIHKATLLDFSLGGLKLEVKGEGAVHDFDRNGGMLYITMNIPIALVQRTVNLFAFVRNIHEVNDSKFFAHCTFIDKLQANFLR